MNRVAAFAVFASVSVLADVSPARDEFPARVQKHLSMGDCVPTCTLCHTVPEGGRAYLRRNAGTALAFTSEKAPDKPWQVESADTDKDGASDLKELQAGTHPYEYGDVPICIPEYGCGARIAPLAPDSVSRAALALLGGVGLAVLARRVRRRPR